MYGDRTRLGRVCCGVLLASAVAGFVAGCSDITPEPNDREVVCSDRQRTRPTNCVESEEHQEGGGGGRGRR